MEFNTHLQYANKLKNFVSNVFLVKLSPNTHLLLSSFLALIFVDTFKFWFMFDLLEEKLFFFPWEFSDSFQTVEPIIYYTFTGRLTLGYFWA